MKSFSSIIPAAFVFALIVGASGAYAPLAHAQNVVSCPSGSVLSSAGVCVPSSSAAASAVTCAAGSTLSSDGVCVTSSGTPASVDPAAAATPTTLPPTYGGTEDSYGGLMTAIMGLFAWLLGVAAITLDNVMYYTVVHMGSYVNGISAIGVAWRILRDIGNIVLIFGFLAIGITTILDVNWYGGGKKMLPTLLIVAVFLNFSLFVSEAVIDAGNLFATEFYTQINNGKAAAPVNYSTNTIRNEGISNAIMSQLGLQSIYGSALKADPKNQIFKSGNTWYIGFMGTLLFLVAAFVMFSLAFILIARFVALIFLIVVAPFGFAGLAVPKLSGTANAWWSALFKNTITAPVLLLLLYVALAVITDVKFLTGFGVSGTSLNPSDNAVSIWNGFLGGDVTGFGSMMLSFLVAMGLLLAVTIVAKKMTIFGAGWATGLGSKLSGAALVVGGAGWVGRSTVGALGYGAAKGLRRTAFGRSFVGRGIAGTLEKQVGKASFDVRNTGLGKTIGGYGLDLGKGQKGGYSADLEARVKSYEASADAMTGGAAARAEKKAADKARKDREAATATHAGAQAKQTTAAAENAKNKAELAPLEEAKAAAEAKAKAEGKESYWHKDPMNMLNLKNAQAAVAASDTVLAEANKKLVKSAEDASVALAKEAEAKKNVGTAKKEAQQAYANRLEKGWSWIPGAGAAAAAAAPRVRSGIGKSRTEKEIAALLKQLKEKTGEVETEETKKAPEKK